MKSTIESTAAGRSPEDFSQQAGISRTTFYALPSDARPIGVKIGRRFVVTESPADWLARMQKRGGVELVKPEKK